MGRVLGHPHILALRERSGYPISAIAIETGLALRLVFHQPLRQTEGMLRSIVDALGVEIAAQITPHSAAEAVA
jgi:hypothetical protein